VTGKPYPAGVDVVYTPAIKDFIFNVEAAGGFKQTFSLQLFLKSSLADSADRLIFTDEITSETQYVSGAMTSGTYVNDAGILMAKAVNEAFLKAAANLADSYELEAYMKKTGGRIEAPPPEAPTQAASASPEDFAAAKDKLRDAFEQGAIKAAQLKRALEESRRAARSKILAAFLSGKIDAKKFGELY
ncbi:MAG: hypothetical protein PHY31_06975, partial [Smithellaceae bacterium]|nr:hypothetical protein [Smithellaceae bacterium]